MADIKVFNNGWVEPTQIQAYQNGWQPVKGLWIYNNGWTKLYPASGSQVFTSSGTFTVPNGVYSLNVSYPTPSGAVDNTVAVTPGQSIPVTINGVRYQDNGTSQAPTATGSDGTSSFGSLVNAPYFDAQVFYWGGGIDAYIDMSVEVATSLGLGYSGSGQNSNLNDAATASGITFSTISAGNNGNIYSTSVQINTVKTELLYGTTQAYVSSGWYGAYDPYGGGGAILGQPSSGNGWIMHVYGVDGPDAVHGRSFAMNLQQAVPFTVSW
jgi:hypothetical protein